LSAKFPKSIHESKSDSKKVILSVSEYFCAFKIATSSASSEISSAYDDHIFFGYSKSTLRGIAPLQVPTSI
jgi:hypothetical protein